MLVTVQLSERLTKMYGYLVKKATQNPDKADVIMAFVDKFLIAEIKESKKTNQTVTMNVSYKNVQVTPVQSEKPRLEVVRKPVSLENTPWQSGKSSLVKQMSLSLGDGKSMITRNRIGNGHEVAKKCKLFDWEKNYIRSQFINLNGIIKEDFCLPIHEKLGDEVSIFQVTGFVTLLHKYVREGELVLPDMNAYWSHINTKSKKVA